MQKVIGNYKMGSISADAAPLSVEQRKIDGEIIRGQADRYGEKVEKFIWRKLNNNGRIADAYT